jgi:hypothetical protein
VGRRRPRSVEGTVQVNELVGCEIVGTGWPGTDTAGWEYRYRGYLAPRWGRGDDQRPTLVGSVIRAKRHGDRPAGAVYSFIAVWKQPFLPPPGQPFLTSRLAGLWTYRSFHNNPTFVKTAPQNAHDLILQEAVFKLETPTTGEPLQGTIEWEGQSLDLQGAVRPGHVEGTGFEPASFQIVGIGRPGTDRYYYQGYLTRHWPEGVDQRPALVGSVMRAKPQEASPAGPAGSVAPFIAVKQ